MGTVASAHDDQEPQEFDQDAKAMNEIGAPASQAGGSVSASATSSKRSRRQTRYSSAKSAAKSKGSYATVRKTRRR
jgi:hypothetical protein